MAEEKVKEKKQAKGGNVVKELLSGILADKVVLKNLWYFIFLTILGAIYIANRFNAEKITRESTRLSREVRDLRAESLSTSATLMSVSRQSEVYRLVREKGLGLDELKAPPYSLIVNK